MTEKEKQEMNKSEGGPSSVKKSRLSTDDTQFKSKGRWTVIYMYIEGGLAVSKGCLDVCRACSLHNKKERVFRLWSICVLRVV